MVGNGALTRKARRRRGSLVWKVEEKKKLRKTIRGRKPSVPSRKQHNNLWKKETAPQGGEFPGEGVKKKKGRELFK